MGGCMGYVASKAGVLQLMKTLATVLAPTGIRFNSIAPGNVPQGRAGDVRDMAGATLFLCGRGGFYCNGALIAENEPVFQEALNIFKQETDARERSWLSKKYKRNQVKPPESLSAFIEFLYDADKRVSNSPFLGIMKFVLKAIANHNDLIEKVANDLIIIVNEIESAN
ncbi:hypothetical protein SAPIO_CDS1967 [Scedosporium apiospermum]|uniref:Uncharacterized protein n=1 Tax=Pseudallescheria apiosperma TaxID=563466 RepID=A0A084GE51_PSEDA|nr:uncharacterized protein SAPIO_CDS1967 [Scedosporium apiospermum]KEZ45613.1 hypothetical protein SAPIO_CDS1967 [Scedosporium apiospermum]